MIQAVFTQTSVGDLTLAEITGHAGSGEFGFDVVCAAASTLAINFCNTLEALVGYEPDLDMNAVEGGYFKVSIPGQLSPEQREKTQLYFASFYLGMRNLADDSPEFVTTTLITES